MFVNIDFQTDNRFVMFRRKIYLKEENIINFWSNFHLKWNTRNKYSFKRQTFPKFLKEHSDYVIRFVKMIYQTNLKEKNFIYQTIHWF